MTSRAIHQSVGVMGWTTAQFYEGLAAELPGDAAFTASVAFYGTGGMGISGERVLWGNYQESAGLVHARGWYIGLSGIANEGPAVVGAVCDGGTLRGLRPTRAEGPDLSGFNVVTLAADATDARVYVNGMLGAQAPVGTAILASTLQPMMGGRFLTAATIDRPATNIPIIGAGYNATKHTELEVWAHWQACQKAGRFVTDGVGSGAFQSGVVPPFGALFDTMINNRGGTVGATANPNIGNMPAAAATWVDGIGSAPTVNLTQQGSALYVCPINLR